MPKPKIVVLCGSAQHPIFPYLEAWKAKHDEQYEVIVSTHLGGTAASGDFLFLISFDRIIQASERSGFRHSLVIHASNLPEGRGWSPHIWDILAGKSTLWVSLIEAEDKVDSGAIWLQETMELEGHELAAEINEKLFTLELALIDAAIERAETLVPKAQSGIPSYHPRRAPEDSQLDPEKTIAEQFDKMRVADPERFPSFFDYRGKRYRLVLEKADHENR